MWVAITSYTIQALSPLCQFLQLKENFNSECQCHRIYDPWLFRSLLYNSGLQSLHVRPVDVRPVALTLVSSATQKYLQCKQVAVHRLLWHCKYDHVSSV